jgi:hypothetical protein
MRPEAVYLGKALEDVPKAATPLNSQRTGKRKAQIELGAENPAIPSEIKGLESCNFIG